MYIPAANKTTSRVFAPLAMVYIILPGADSKGILLTFDE
jgi:hypothetical protein